MKSKEDKQFEIGVYFCTLLTQYHVITFNNLKLKII